MSQPDDKKTSFGGNRSLDVYLHEINKTPLLKREEEQQLARRIREGHQDALDGLVKANLRFVVSIAKQYSNQGLSLEDLINDGNLGLIKAAHRFDEKRGYKGQPEVDCAELEGKSGRSQEHGPTRSVVADRVDIGRHDQ